jgi:hypothetical protein
MSDWISELLPYVWSVPLFMIFLAGLVVAAVNLAKCPRVAVLSGVAFLMLLGSVFANLALSIWVRQAGAQAAGGDIERVYFVFGLAQAAVHVVAYGLLITAVFIDRTATAPFQQSFARTK